MVCARSGSAPSGAPTNTLARHNNKPEDQVPPTNAPHLRQARGEHVRLVVPLARPERRARHQRRRELPAAEHDAPAGELVVPRKHAQPALRGRCCRRRRRRRPRRAARAASVHGRCHGLGRQALRPRGLVLLLAALLGLAEARGHGRRHGVKVQLLVPP